MDTNFLKAQAERCRSLAEIADEFTKRRLLDLAENYDKRLKAAGPAAATRVLIAPFRLTETAKQISASLLRLEDSSSFCDRASMATGKTVEHHVLQDGGGGEQ